MSNFEELRKSLDVLDYLGQRQNFKEIQSVDRASRETAMLRIQQLEGDIKRKDATIAKLRKDADATENLVQQRAVILAERLVAERLPAAINEGVQMEISGYPFNCSENTSYVMNKGIQDCYAKALKRSWWAPLLLTPATNPTNK